MRLKQIFRWHARHIVEVQPKWQFCYWVVHLQKNVLGIQKLPQKAYLSTAEGQTPGTMCRVKKTVGLSGW